MDKGPNPLLVKSTLTHGAPHYDRIKPEHFMPAFKEAMTQHRAEVELIANNVARATFDNTLAMLEQSGTLLQRVERVFSSIASMTSEASIEAVDAEIKPLKAAHEDAINLNPKLFARVESVYKNRRSLRDPEDRRLVKVVYEKMIRAGAKLSEAKKAEIRKINEELATSRQLFTLNLSKATDAGAILVTDKAKLAGLSDEAIASLASAATKQGKTGYLIALQNTTRHPLLSKLSDRGLRERLWRSSSQRAPENEAVIRRIASLRRQKAKLLGFKTWGAYALDAEMAKTTEAALKLVKDLVPQIMDSARKEAAEIEVLMRAEGISGAVQPWDWLYYAEKIRAQKFNLDQETVRPYFEINRVLKDGIFFSMKELLGIRFAERNDLPVYHPDVKVYEVFDENNKSIGVFYTDYYNRPGKDGGAWAHTIAPQSELLKQSPIVVNSLNVPKPADGQPTLLSSYHVLTMFHEIGHAVHVLMAKVRYARLSGLEMPRDFVEFPSQFQEDWRFDPKVVKNYARHYQSGAEIPADLMQRIRDTRNFNQGFEMLEFLKAIILDLEFHAASDAELAGNIADFERKIFEKHGVAFDAIPPRYHLNYFAHLFRWGYSSRYYSYLWSEILAADAFAYMGTRGGLNRRNGKEFERAVLQNGNSVDLMDQFVDYRGQEPTVDAFLQRRGLKKSE